LAWPPSSISAAAKPERQFPFRIHLPFVVRIPSYKNPFPSSLCPKTSFPPHCRPRIAPRNPQRPPPRPNKSLAGRSPSSWPPGPVHAVAADVSPWACRFGAGWLPPTYVGGYGGGSDCRLSHGEKMRPRRLPGRNVLWRAAAVRSPSAPCASSSSKTIRRLPRLS
jgi:hypothetical protein